MSFNSGETFVISYRKNILAKNIITTFIIFLSPHAFLVIFEKNPLLKRLVAITLLSIYLFNLAGYTLLFALLNDKSNSVLAYKIDRHLYNDKDLVLVKVPLNLPYSTSQNEYEAFEGSVTMGGNHYNYVKRKISSDTLFILCLPNTERDKLQLAKSNYAKSANGFEGKNEKNDMAKMEKSFSSYHEKQNDYLLTRPAVNSNKLFSFISLFVPDTFISFPDLPPEVNS